jgi:hypothetical protein
MKTNDDLVAASQFIIENERNIEIATVIYEQYTDAREELVKRFLDRLTAALKARLPGWSCRYTLPFFTKRYGAFDLFKKAWGGCYAIRLEAYDWGKGMIYGVWRDASLLQVPPAAKLLAAIREKLPRATSRPWYEAEIVMNSPASDWRTPSALWRMHSDQAFLAEVEASLLEIVGLAETSIDTMANAASTGAKK